MTMDVKPPAGEMAWLRGHDFRSGKAGAGSRKARFIWLALVAVVGMASWMTFPGPSGAQSPLAPAMAPLIVPTQTPSWFNQNTSWFNPAIAPTVATLATAPVGETRLTETMPVDGLSISSQSWRRGGLGSKALATFTLRNGNDYAVRDVEISCAFTRKDGSHLTDRRRTIRDIVSMKSRKTFARMHIGFVNVNADRAKCLPLSASRIERN